MCHVDTCIGECYRKCNQNGKISILHYGLRLPTSLCSCQVKVRAGALNFNTSMVFNRPSVNWQYSIKFQIGLWEFFWHYAYIIASIYPLTDTNLCAWGQDLHGIPSDCNFLILINFYSSSPTPIKKRLSHTDSYMAIKKILLSDPYMYL